MYFVPIDICVVVVIWEVGVAYCSWLRGFGLNSFNYRLGYGFYGYNVLNRCYWGWRITKGSSCCVFCGKGCRKHISLLLIPGTCLGIWVFHTYKRLKG